MASHPKYTLSDVAEALGRGDEALVAVSGRSMLPYLRPGRDVALLRRSEGDVTPGEIVLARWGDAVVLHRVVACDAGGLTLMGDGNLRQTERVATADVLGVAVMVDRGGRRKFRPSKARLWRRLRPARRILLKLMFWL